MMMPPRTSIPLLVALGLFLCLPDVNGSKSFIAISKCSKKGAWESLEAVIPNGDCFRNEFSIKVAGNKISVSKCRPAGAPAVSNSVRPSLTWIWVSA
jgi:hypothetical protein